MRVVNNNRHIRKRAKIGQIANIAGISILGLGLVISLTMPEYSIFTLGLLLLGVLTSQYGIVNAYRYARKPRPDEELAAALKGLDDRHRLYNYVLPAYHVLLTPRQVYVLVTRGVSGKIIAEGARWRTERRFSLGRILRIFSPENLGNPVRDARWDQEALMEWITKNAPEEGPAVAPEALVVFLHPAAEIEARNPEVRPVRAKALKEAVRKSEGPGLSGEDYRKLARLFDQAAGEAEATDGGGKRGGGAR